MCRCAWVGVGRSFLIMCCVAFYTVMYRMHYTKFYLLMHIQTFVFFIIHGDLLHLCCLDYIFICPYVYENYLTCHSSCSAHVICPSKICYFAQLFSYLFVLYPTHPMGSSQLLYVVLLLNVLTMIYRLHPLSWESYVFGGGDCLAPNIFYCIFILVVTEYMPLNILSL